MFISWDKLGLYNKVLVLLPKKNFYNIIMICVPHKRILKLSDNKIKSYTKKNSIIFDLKSSFSNRNYYFL
tara:strand:+ start:665 stop:874 length:210 start_codon:yes stop_codon:yes gene_type:complete